jgi:hypothetical protein
LQVAPKATQGYTCGDDKCWKLFDPSVEAKKAKGESQSFVLAGAAILVVGLVLLGARWIRVKMSS